MEIVAISAAYMASTISIHMVVVLLYLEHANANIYNKSIKETHFSYMHRLFCKVLFVKKVMKLDSFMRGWTGRGGRGYGDKVGGIGDGGGGIEGGGGGIGGEGAGSAVEGAGSGERGGGESRKIGAGN